MSDRGSPDTDPSIIRGAFYMAFDQSFTGGPRVLVNLLQGIDRERFSIVAITNKTSPMTEELEALGFAVRIIELDRPLQPRGGRSVTWNPFRLVGNVRSTLSYNRRVGAILDEFQSQVVWVRNIKGVLLTGFAARRRRLPLVWDIGMEKQSRGLVLGLHFFGFLLSAKVIAEAQTVFRQNFPGWLRKWFARKIDVNRSGISEQRVALLEDCRRNYQATPGLVRILNVATVNDRKNQMMLLRALQLVNDDRVTIDFIGPPTDPHYQQQLEAFVQQHSLQNRVRFLGWRDDIPQQLGKADLFVLCSRNEGVPYSILEAMQASVPIIATRCGGVPDVIEAEKTGVLLDIDDHPELARRIREYQSDGDKYASIAANAKRYVDEHHRLADWRQRYQRLLEQLVLGPGPTAIDGRQAESQGK